MDRMIWFLCYKAIFDVSFKTNENATSGISLFEAEPTSNINMSDLKYIVFILYKLFNYIYRIF